MTLCEQYRKEKQAVDETGPNMLIELAKRDSDPLPGDVDLLKSELDRTGRSFDHFSALVSAREQFIRHYERWANRGTYEAKLSELKALHASKGEAMDFRPGGLDVEIQTHLQQALAGFELQGKLRLQFGPALFSDLEATHACPEPLTPAKHKGHTTYKGFCETGEPVRTLSEAEAAWNDRAGVEV